MPEFKLSPGATIYTDGAFHRVQEAAKAALECLVWSEEPDGRDWSKISIHREVAYSIMMDVADFMSIPDVMTVVDKNMCDPRYIGHNLYLSANGHGSGFFDTDLPYGGQDILQLEAKAFIRHLYVDEDLFTGESFIRSE